MSELTFSLFSYLIVISYAFILGILMLYGIHRYWIVYLYWKNHKKRPQSPPPELDPAVLPVVTIQLPIYNERYVVDRLLNAVVGIEYPKDKLEIQVLDDSTDDTVEIAAKSVKKWVKLGFQIRHMRRTNRSGYKAGALSWGLSQAQGEFVAIFDADFVPPKEFLKKALPHFQNQNVGMVQARWGHLNAAHSLMTRLQSVFLDGHFVLEHTARFKSGAFFNFNGTAGIWRKEAIVSAGGWNARTVTEDLDLSYRAQLKGWKFIYLPDLVCPAELPVDIYSFRSQQKRWTQGAVQVARYVLKDIWKANIPLITKIESTAHLTANIGYVLTLLISILLLPSLLVRSHIGWSGVGFVETIAFFTTMVSVTFFYAYSQRELYPNWRWRLKDLPALLSFGIGMCISNAKAVFIGLFTHRKEFLRTPKFGRLNRKENWKGKAYAKSNCELWYVQVGLAMYVISTFIVAAFLNNWGALPFIFLFVFGYVYVTGLSYTHRSESGCQ